MPKSEVYNMDCMEFMRSLPDKFFDLAIADPPYGSDNSAQLNGGGILENSTQQIQCSRTGGTWAAKFGRGIKSWDVAPTQDFFEELARVSKNQVIWGANYFPNMPPTRCFLVWKKLTISEKFTMAMAEYAWTSFNSNAKLFEAAPQDPTGKRFHPTAKPVSLYGWTMRMLAKEGQTIFDPMMGSQSSRIAAYKMGLYYTGCEIDIDYYNKGNERFLRECMGEEIQADGKKVTQLTLF